MQLNSADNKVKNMLPKEVQFAYSVEKFRTSSEYYAFHLKVSKLLPKERDSQLATIATDTFKKFTQHLDNINIFTFYNGDIVCIYPAGKIKEIFKIAKKVRQLFGESGLTKENPSELSGALYKNYDLESEHQEVCALAQFFIEQSGNRDHFSLSKNEVLAESIKPHHLDKLVRALETVDLTNFMRSQPVCIIDNKNKVEVVFNEHYISISELQKRTMPKVNFTADTWLFQYLCHSLDDRMLLLLMKGDKELIINSFSINMTTASILTPQFNKFSDHFDKISNSTFIIEFDTVDVFGNLRQFESAREIIRRRGYRLCIDGLSFNTLPYIAREQLDIDLIKIYWKNECSFAKNKDKYKKYIEEIGAERTILCHCDSPDAIDFGHDLGITMFQGRYIKYYLQDD
jgi:hypothetical protein